MDLVRAGSNPAECILLSKKKKVNKKIGHNGDWTHDQWLIRPTLYRLSYAPISDNPQALHIGATNLRKLLQASVAEWLRRQTQVLVNFVGVSSILNRMDFFYDENQKKRFYRDLNPDYKDQNLGC